jgi:hypothetical protein
MHAGKSLAKARAQGQVVVELRSWGLDMDEVRDPGMTLLQLMTQSAMRVELYSQLLGEAYEAAERIRDSHPAPVGFTSPDGLSAVDVPGQQPNATDLDRAKQDLDRIFATGGVAALVGYKYGTAGQEGYLYAAEEAIRGLVQLEAAERDRCANMATKAIAAGLAERQVRLAESQGAQVVDLIRRVMSSPLVALTDGQRDAAQQVAAAELRALAGVA